MSQKLCDNCFSDRNESESKSQMSCQSIDSLINSYRMKPKVVLKRLTINEIEKYDKYFFNKYLSQKVDNNKSETHLKMWSKNVSKVNHLLSNSLFKNLNKCSFNSKSESISLLVKEEYNEKELNSMNELSEYCLHLDLVSTQLLSNKSMDSLKTSYPLRRIARIEPLIRDQFGDILLDGNVVINQTIERNDNSVENNETSNQYLLRNKFRQQLKTGLNVNKTKKQMEKVLKREHNSKMKSLKGVSRLPFSTSLGLRVCRTLPQNCLSSTHIPNTIQKSESFCRTDKSYKSWSTSKYNNWNCSSIERKTFRTNLTKSSSDSFYYSFNRRQRLEKMKRIETGLNWKSRLRSLHCKQVFVKLFDYQNCSICGNHLNVGHNCDESANNSLVSELSNKQLDQSFDLSESGFDSMSQNNSSDDFLQIESSVYGVKSDQHLESDLVQKIDKSFVVKGITIDESDIDFISNKCSFGKKDRILTINLDQCLNEKICEIDLDLKNVD
jgi:hypothetical protein